MGMILLFAVFPVVLVTGCVSVLLALIGLISFRRRARPSHERKPWGPFFATALGLLGIAVFGVLNFPWDWGKPGSNASEMMFNTCMMAGLIVLAPGASICLSSLVTVCWQRRSLRAV